VRERHTSRTSARAAVTLALCASVLAPLVAVTAAHAASVQTRWHLRHAEAGNTVFASVSCPTTSVCTAVGYGPGNGGPAIFRTTSAGATWTRQAPPAGIGLLATVSCPTVTSCLAAGQTALSGYVISTSDAGAHWHVRAVPGETSGVVQLDCVTAARCFATAYAPLPAVLSTTNGGASWATTALPGPPGDGLTQVGGISCATTTTCVVAEDFTAFSGNTQSTQLLVDKTVDGAGHFGQVETTTGGAFSIPQVSCPTLLACAVTGAGEGDELLATTADGGTTWATPAVPAEMYFAVDVACVDALDCTVTGPSTASFDVDVATSTDGATSWGTAVDVAASTGADFSRGEMSCAAIGACALVGFATPDGSVPLVTGPSGTWSLTHVPSGRTSLTAVDCALATRCVAVGGDTAMRSPDGGKTWGPSATHLPGDLTLLSVACATATRCIAVGYTVNQTTFADVAAAYRTTNAGGTWQRLRLPVAPAVTSIACPTQSTCVATTAPLFGSLRSGGVLLTRNAGASWSRASTPPLPFPDGLSSVSCGTAATCTAVGQHNGFAYVLTSVDAGVKWKSAHAPGGLESLLESVSCVSATTCLAVGVTYQGTPTPLVARTVDAGRHWTYLHGPGRVANVTSISCSTVACHAFGFAPRANGTSFLVAATLASGATSWTMDQLPAQTQSLGGVTAATPSKWVAVGADTDNGPLCLSSP
jgi:hypothetical protein